MKIGNLKVVKHYNPGNSIKWAVHGRNPQGNWVLCYDEKRKEKNLVFDLKYDACCYLQAFVDWIKETMKAPFKPKKPDIPEPHNRDKEIRKRRNRNKAARKARKRNR